MKASDLFVRCLEREGVRTIFGVPGEENADLMMSLLDSSIEFVIAPEPKALASPATVEAWQSRAQWSTLFVPSAALMNFWKR